MKTKMKMKMNAVLMRGDLAAEVLSEVLAGMGYHPTGRNISGLLGDQLGFVETCWQTSADRPVEVLRLGHWGGWTILADGSGVLSEHVEAWCDASAVHATRVVTARLDDLGIELAIYEHGNIVRFISRDLVDGIIERGDPTPLEPSTHCEATAESLALWLSGQGIDLQEINETVAFDAIELEVQTHDAANEPRECDEPPRASRSA